MSEHTEEICFFLTWGCFGWRIAKHYSSSGEDDRTENKEEEVILILTVPVQLVCAES